MKVRNLIIALYAVITAGALFSSCEYDDTELREKINDHENRIAQLEELCNQMNTNISSLQTIVTALQNNDYVTSITPITSGDKTVGYTVNFSKSGPVTIYHGQDGKDGVNGEDGKDGADGKDGHTPVLGVKMTTDGNYYWTIDGEWLLDDEGNKIRANGIDGQNGADGSDGDHGNDGQNGITPLVKIENGYWYVSYDKGESWEQLGEATIDSTPNLGIQQDTDGNYYWTVNGEWLLDNEGNKIRANGIDGQDGADGNDGQNGKDGITPQLKIEEGYWYISYDNGSSWNQLGKATGENGNDGIDGDSMFSMVTYDDEFVYLVLADKTTTLIIPRKTDEFDILFPSGNDMVCSSGETFAVPYNLTYGDENTIVTVIPHGGWDAIVEKSDNTSGIISVTAPIPMNNSEIIVLASAAQDKTVMRKLSFKQGEMSIVTDSYIADTNGDIIEVELNTNLNYSVSIPEDARDWISISEESTKAEMRNDIVILNVTANMGTTRTAEISFVNTADQILGTISVLQTASDIANNEIWYTSSDGNIVEPDTYYTTNTIISNTKTAEG